MPDKFVNTLFDSYRSRYLLLGILLTLALGVVAGLGYLKVQQASDSHFDRITQRNRVSTMLTNLDDGRNELLELLQNVVIEPKKIYVEKIPNVLERLNSGITDLQNEKSINSSERNLIVNELKRDLNELQERSTRLIEIRLDELLWFPATEELQFELLPRFTNSITLLQDMALSYADQRSTEEQEVYKTIQETRLIWVRMTAELRLLVANRFGVFSVDTEKGMAGRY